MGRRGLGSERATTGDPNLGRMGDAMIPTIRANAATVSPT
jgi:hypothetical protein